MANAKISRESNESAGLFCWADQMTFCYHGNSIPPNRLPVLIVSTSRIVITSPLSRVGTSSCLVFTDSSVIRLSSSSKQKNISSSESGFSSVWSSPGSEGILRESSSVLSRLSMSPPLVTIEPGGSGRSNVMCILVTRWKAWQINGTNLNRPIWRVIEASSLKLS